MRPLILALLLLGCASPVRTVYAVPGLEAAARIAVGAWEYRALRTCPDDLQIEFAPYEHAGILIQFEDGLWENSGRYGHAENGDIWMDTDRALLDPGFLPTMISHELGHALGLKHSPFVEDIMLAPLWGDRDPWPSTRDVYLACRSAE